MVDLFSDPGSIPGASTSRRVRIDPAASTKWAPLLHLGSLCCPIPYCSILRKPVELGVSTGVSRRHANRGGMAMGVSGRSSNAIQQSRGLNRLSDAKVRAFVGKSAAGKPAKLFDGGGLFLARTTGGASWRIKYRYAGVERLYSIGPYPSITLESARAERDIVRAQLREGIDPVQARQIRRAERTTATSETFEKTAEAWFEKNKRFWSDVHYDKARQAFERDVYPTLGRLPVADITPAIVASVISKMLERGVAETASKVLQHVNGVFRFAQAKGLRVDNPAAPARELIPKKRVVKPRPAILEIEQLRDLLRQVDAARVSEAVRIANRLCAFSACRLGNVVMAEWPEFELEVDVPTWTIPREKMKAKDRQHDHIVYLGPTIAAELRAWRRRMPEKARYVFPGNAGREFVDGRPLRRCIAKRSGWPDGCHRTVGEAPSRQSRRTRAGQGTS